MDHVTTTSGEHSPTGRSSTTASEVPVSSIASYRAVRGLTETIAAPLTPEDQTVQSMADVSPTKWHRAHVSWFFETFLLREQLAGYRAFHPVYAYLFNSYYEGVGDRYPRPRRGVVSRPGVAEVTAYRSHVDDAMEKLLDGSLDRASSDLVVLGLNHEQQHQELMLMDIKHVLSCSPIQPAYAALETVAPRPSSPAALLEHDGGIVEIGHDESGFGFDNEFPRHCTHLNSYAIDARPVTCGDWMAFIDDAGYRRPELWLSDGWAAVNADGWEAPLYWYWIDDRWWSFTLGGPRHVDAAEPVCHVSYYEADAFARWAGARLPTEAEWEALANEPAGANGSSSSQATGNFLDVGVLHPKPVGERSSLFGDVWQWTSSSYGPYPGFHPAPGAVGEYNGKFMVNQYVLRGGCCVTPVGHVRVTYRNFFPPGARWAFSGLRLAHDR